MDDGEEAGLEMAAMGAAAMAEQAARSASATQEPCGGPRQRTLPFEEVSHHVLPFAESVLESSAIDCTDRTACKNVHAVTPSTMRRIMSATSTITDRSAIETSAAQTRSAAIPTRATTTAGVLS